MKLFKIYLLSDEIKRRLISGSFWSIINSVFARGLNIVTGVFLARMLGKESFGEFGIIQNSVIMFQVVASCGIGITCSKHVSEYKFVQPDAAGKVVGFSYIFSILSGMIIASIFYSSSSYISEYILVRTDILSALQLSSVILIIGTVDATQIGVLTGLESFRTQTIFSLICGVLILMLTLYGAKLHGVFGAISGMTV